jgi:sec-independent protein translocase protein TatA
MRTLFENVFALPIGMEWIILLVVVVIFLFGARKIPDLARSVGRAKGEFEKGKQEYEKELKNPGEGAAKKNTSEREKLEQAAKSLGIDFENKSDEELKDILKKRVSNTSS